MSQQTPNISEEARTEAPEHEDRARGRTIRFVAVFIISVLALFVGYRYLVSTALNDWYLFKVAQHTTWVLDHIGYSCELEAPTGGALKPAEVRATLKTWAKGKDRPTPEACAAADNSPLSAWERYRYRMKYERRRLPDYQSSPNVSFVLRPDLTLRTREAENRLNELLESGKEGDPQRTAAIEAATDRLTALKAEQEKIKKGEKPAAPEKARAFGFIVVSECGAIEVMAIFFAAVMAFPTRWWKRLVGLAIGLPIMYGVNIFRLSCLGVVGALAGNGPIFDFAHHYVWQAIYIIFVVAGWLVWVEYLVNRETWVDSAVTEFLTKNTRTRKLMRFCVNFAVWIVVVMVAWWWLLLPYYGYVILQASGGILRFVLREPILAGHIVASGLLNTETQVVFVLPAGHERAMPIALLVTNLAPYWALVLATSGLGLWRRFRILAYGSGILFAGHILFIVLIFRFQESWQRDSELPTAIIQFFLTLPFLLWVIFAYWDHIANYLRETGPHTGPVERKEDGAP
jgi:exosortase/archaeosortase family protein